MTYTPIFFQTFRHGHVFTWVYTKQRYFFFLLFLTKNLRKKSDFFQTFRHGQLLQLLRKTTLKYLENNAKNLAFFLKIWKYLLINMQ